MPEYAEITSWSTEELREYILEALPKGWKFNSGGDNGHLWCHILQPEGDGWIKVWESFHLDEKTLLLGAYSWLWLRGQPVRDTKWVRKKGDLTRKGVTQQVVGSSPQPEPFEDLNAEYIQSVYEEARKKRS